MHLVSPSGKFFKSRVQVDLFAILELKKNRENSQCSIRILNIYNMLVAITERVSHVRRQEALALV